VLTGKTVRREYELSVLAQSIPFLHYKLKNTNNVNKASVNNSRRHTNKTAFETAW